MILRSRTTALAAGVLSIALAAAGCGSSDSGNSQGSSGGSNGGSTSGSGGAFPVTIPTKFGNVTVNSKPQRVVALGWGDAETALELGTQPVGASDWLNFGGEGVGPWAKGLYTNGAPKIIGTLEPSYEQIAALKPDLILDTKSSGDQTRYERLSKIAPTVGVPQGGDNYLTKPAQQMDLVASALGEKKKGQKLLKGVDDKFAQVAKAHPAWKGKTATAATKSAEGWAAYVKDSDRVQFLEKLGFTQNPKVAAMDAKATGFFVSISPEQIGTLDANLVVAFPIFIDAKQITGDTAWQSVPAVKAGHGLVISGDEAQAYSLGTPSATKYAIDKITPKIEAVIK